MDLDGLRCLVFIRECPYMAQERDGLKGGGPLRLLQSSLPFPYGQPRGGAEPVKARAAAPEPRTGIRAEHGEA